MSVTDPSLIKALIALTLWGATVIGWLGRPLPVWLRLLAAAAAASLVAALPLTDEIGLALTAAFAVLAWRMQPARAA